MVDEAGCVVHRRKFRQYAEAAAGLALLALALQLPALSLLTPRGGEKLARGSRFIVRWSAAGAAVPVWLHLVRDDREVGVMAGPLPAAREECAWVVGRFRGGLAEAGSGYRVRVMAGNGELLAASDRPFAIAGDPKARGAVLVPHIVNAHRRTRWDNGHQECLFLPAPEAVPLPVDPGPWAALAGYQNTLKNWNQCQRYEGLIFRAFLYFDLPVDAPAGTVLQAELSYQRADDAANGVTDPWPLWLYAVTEPWSGPNTPRAPDFAIALESGSVDLTSLAQSWLTGSWAAHGLLVTGPDETFRHNSEYRLSVLRRLRLQIEYLVR